MRRNERARAILTALKAAPPGGVVSGASLGGDLGISRTALHKYIDVLRAGGFSIEALRGRGYRLVGEPEFSADALMSSVTRDLGREAVFYKAVSSTNEIAMEEAARGAAHGFTVVADAQLGGRGRRGRAWVTPPGKSIALSVVIVPDIPVRSAPLLSVIAAMAMSQTLREMTSVPAVLKWPNDIVIENSSGGYRKLGGVLLEMRSEAERTHYAVLGIGLNVSAEAGDFPPEVREIATSVLMVTGRTYTRVPLMAAFLDRYSWWLAVHRDHGPETVLKAVRLLSMTIGRTVTIQDGGNSVVEGEAVDIDEDGLLLVREPHTKGLLRVHAGDVTVLGRARGESGG